MIDIAPYSELKIAPRAVFDTLPERRSRARALAARLQPIEPDVDRALGPLREHGQVRGVRRPLDVEQRARAEHDLVQDGMI